MKSFKSNSFLILLVCLFAVACSTMPTVSPDIKSGARSAATDIPGRFSGHWTLMNFYASTVPQNNTGYNNTYGCPLNNRWIYFSNNGSTTATITNQDGCRNSWSSFSQPKIEFLSVSNQAGERVTYSLGTNVFGPQNDLLNLYRGSSYLQFKVTYGTNAQNNLTMTFESLDGSFAAVYRRAEWYDNVPSI